MQALNLFSEEMRRDPHPVYEKLRAISPVLHVAEVDTWLILDYDGVKKALSDHDAFTSRVGPEWLVFLDPPRHTKLRALISAAFTPKSVAKLETRIRELARQLLEPHLQRGEFDLALDFATVMPMLVIAEMLGIPVADRPRFTRWSDAALGLSDGFFGGDIASKAVETFRAASAEMKPYVDDLIDRRRAYPQDDLLTRLVLAEVENEQLTNSEILAFFQLLLVGGQETTTNLVNNAMLCFIENPEQLSHLRTSSALLPSAIEEVLRFRSPFQWTVRAARHDVDLHGKTIPAGKRVLAVMGSANRDPKQFPDPNRFAITREPNQHIAFGHGIHFCLGAPLARLEARVALSELLNTFKSFRLANTRPWEPRRALHVHGPARLPLQFEV